MISGGGRLESDLKWHLGGGCCWAAELGLLGSRGWIWAAGQPIGAAGQPIGAAGQLWVSLGCWAAVSELGLLGSRLGLLRNSGSLELLCSSGSLELLCSSVTC